MESFQLWKFLEFCKLYNNYKVSWTFILEMSIKCVILSTQWSVSLHFSGDPFNHPLSNHISWPEQTFLEPFWAHFELSPRPLNAAGSLFMLWKTHIIEVSQTEKEQKSSVDQFLRCALENICFLSHCLGHLPPLGDTKNGVIGLNQYISLYVNAWCKHNYKKSCALCESPEACSGWSFNVRWSPPGLETHLLQLHISEAFFPSLLR